MKSFKHTLLVVITSGGLAVWVLGIAHAAPAGSMRSEISITNNKANDVMDIGGIALGVGGWGKKILNVEGRQGDPNTAETVVQGVKHNGTLPVEKIIIRDNKAEKIKNMGGRLLVQGVSVR